MMISWGRDLELSLEKKTTGSGNSEGRMKIWMSGREWVCEGHWDGDGAPRSWTTKMIH